MACPLCEFAGTPRQLHAHLGDLHPDHVRFEERGANHWYGVTCPLCGDGYEHLIKPRSRDPRFVAEFEQEIRLVAFDMLVNHLIAEHEEAELP
jgi:hypothetical protein